MELLNNAMIAIGANIRSGNPILSAWVKENSLYAFLEFRTPEEANNAFKLDGINILGKVKIVLFKNRTLKLVVLDMKVRMLLIKPRVRKISF